MIWKFSRCTIPRMVCRVVCGLIDVIATLAPTSALVSVDLPVFGRPTKHTKPERNSLMSPSVHAEGSRAASQRATGAVGDDHYRRRRQFADRGDPGIVDGPAHQHGGLQSDRPTGYGRRHR